MSFLELAKDVVGTYVRRSRVRDQHLRFEEGIELFDGEQLVAHAGGVETYARCVDRGTAWDHSVMGVEAAVNFPQIVEGLE